MRVVVVLISTVTALVAVITSHAGVPGASPVSSAATISHIGIVVRDIERASELVASLTGARSRPFNRPIPGVRPDPLARPTCA